MLSIGVGAEEIPRTPPRLYTDELAAQLTPVSEAVKLTNPELEKTSPAITLVGERIYHVEGDGRCTMVRQLVRKSISDAGAHSCSEETFSFRKKEQRFYLVLAETIEPDGSVQPVKENAILLQTPERQAQYALYDDVSEVRIIFPNVKPGSLTHVIYVIEDVRARMPGEFSEQLTWSSTWPFGRIRYVIDLPESLARRVRVETVGAGVPAVKRTTGPTHRLRLVAQKDLIPPDRDEVAAAPEEQVGPCLHVSTVAAWDDIARWYADLLHGRGELNAKSVATIDKWLEGSTARPDIIATLFHKVANDVRYTGLEFGESEYRPHECNEVWENQYGDCKDKANLLVSFLRHQGIISHIALLNAAHAGLIDRRIPDYQVFNHAIVAIAKPAGGFEFCDPTLEDARPGLLSPSDADRDVFIVGDNKGEWIHTPAQDGGDFSYDFDLTLKATGELSGWMTLKATGFYATAESAYFRKLDDNDTRRAVSEMIRGFYPGAELVDVQKPKSGTAPDPFTLKAYLLTRRVMESGSGQQSLAFPELGWLFSPLGYSSERQTPYYRYPGKIIVTAVTVLPENTSASNRPPDFGFRSPTDEIHAAWTIDGTRCRAELEVNTTQATLGPGEFSSFYNTMQSLRGWLGKPMLVEVGIGKSSQQPAVTELADSDFPQMPTGLGQIVFTEKRFPVGSNPVLRRAALEKTLQYFPEDKQTVFQASVMLCDLDWREGRKQEVMLRLQLLLTAYRHDLAPNIVAWGEGMYAFALKELGREAEARDILVRLAHNAALDPDTRVRAAIGAAGIVKQSTPEKALELLEPAFPLKSQLVPDAYAEYAHILLAQSQTAKVKEKLAAAIAANPGSADELLTGVIAASATWVEAGAAEQQDKLLTTIEQLRPSPSAGLAAAIRETRSRRAGAASVARSRDELSTALAEPSLRDWYDKYPSEGLKTDIDFDQAIAAANQKGDLDRGFRLALRAAVTMPAENFGLRMTRVVGYIEMLERSGMQIDERAVRAIFRATDGLPTDDAAYQSGRLIHAVHYAVQQDFARERDICQALLAQPDLMEQYRQNAVLLLGGAQEALGQYEQAVATYTSAEKYARAMPGVAHVLLRATFMNLSLGHPDAAIKLIHALDRLGPAVTNQVEGAQQISALIVLEHHGKSLAYWKRRESWWSQWQALAKTLGLPDAGDETIVPVIANEIAFGTALGPSWSAGDRKAYFQVLRRAISAARWVPLDTTYAANSLSAVEKLAPDLLPAYRKLIIAMLESAADDLGLPEDNNLIQLALAGCYTDENRTTEGRKIAERLTKILAPTDPSRFALHRIRGALAIRTRSDQDESSELLEADLRGTDPTPARGNSVLMLASLYESMGDKTKERELLTREMGRPDVTADASVKEQLARLAHSLETYVNASGRTSFVRVSLAGEGGKPLSDTEVDLTPKPLDGPTPANPTAQARPGTAHIALVDVTVDRTGTVIEVDDYSSPTPAFARAAIDALAQWKFEPAVKGGRKVAAIIRVPVEFTPGQATGTIIWQPWKNYVPNVPDATSSARTLNTSLAAPEFESTPTGVALSDGPPKLLKRVAPIYPTELTAKKVEGTVVVQFVVDAEGSVVSAHVVSSPNQLLSDAAIAAVFKWVFAPGRKNGAAIRTKMQVPVVFSLPLTKS